MGWSGSAAKMPEEKRDNLADDELKQAVAFPPEVFRQEKERKSKVQGRERRYESFTRV